MQLSSGKHMTDNIQTEALVTAAYTGALHQWNKRNAAGMTAYFATDSTYIGFDGSQLNGQKEIYTVMDEIFTHYPTAAYVSIIKEIRILSPDTALLLAVAGMVAEGSDDITPTVNVIQTATLVLRDGTWKIALLQNTPAAFHGRPEMNEQLSADLRIALQTNGTV